MIEQIMALAETRLKKLDQRRRETVPASELILGMQCGGSDAFSGITANPALGYAADLLVRAGATVMFSEVTEVRDAIYMLTSRAETPEVAEALVREMDWYDRYLQRRRRPQRQHHAGQQEGRLVEHRREVPGLDRQVRQQRHPGRARPGRAGERKGLIFCATPASDFVCGTLQLAAGMNLHVFTTGRGTPYGLAMAPVVKVHPHRAGPALARPDRHRRRAHRHRPLDHRGAGLGAVPLLPGRGQRPQADLGRAARAAQRHHPVQPGADYLMPRADSISQLSRPL
jgi:galactarate dehydratase